MTGTSNVALVLVASMAVMIFLFSAGSTRTPRHFVWLSKIDAIRSDRRVRERKHRGRARWGAGKVLKSAERARAEVIFKLLRIGNWPVEKVKSPRRKQPGPAFASLCGVCCTGLKRDICEVKPNFWACGTSFLKLRTYV